MGRSIRGAAKAVPLSSTGPSTPPTTPRVGSAVEQRAGRVRIDTSTTLGASKPVADSSRAAKGRRLAKRIRYTPMARASLHSELQTYLEQINGVPLLGAEDEKNLGWLIINDQCCQAKERMIKANLRLVIAIGKQYAGRGVALADLIEEGNLGLIRAVDGYDPAQGTRFSTYAAWWIKQAIRRMLSSAAQPIHVPAYMVDLIHRLRDCSRRLEEQLRRPPSITELSRTMKLPVRKISAIQHAMKAFQCAGHAPTGENGDALDFGEVLADTRNSPPDQRLSQTEQFELVLEILETLDERDARILRLRFGLEGQVPRTLKEIGNEIGLTRERVRQIEVETLRRLQARLTEENSRGVDGRSRRRKAG